MDDSLLDKKRTALIVTAITLAGFGLRFWKLAHGLPQAYYGDEAWSSAIPLEIKSLRFEPGPYPHFFYYLYFLCDLVFVGYGLLTGLFQKAGDAWLLYKNNPTVFYVIGRGLSAFLGSLTIPLVYLCGKKMFDRTAGIVAASFMAFSFLHLQWSQIAYRDATLTFLIMAGFWFSLLALESGYARYFILGGFISGLAASTKYQALITILWGPLAGGLLALKISRSSVSTAARLSLAFCAMFAAGLICGTPYLVLGFERMKSHFETVWSFTWGNTEFLGKDGKWNWFYYLTGPLLYGLGLPLLLASLAGFILLFRRCPKNIFFLSFPAVYFLIIGLAHRQKSSYALPLVPFLCLAAAYFVIVFAFRFRLRGANFHRFFIPFLTVLLVLPNLITGLRYLYLRTLPDTRNLAWQWLEIHVPQDQKVLVSPYVYFRGSRFSPLASLDRIRHISDLETLEEYKKQGADYIILADWYLNVVFIEGRRHGTDAALVERHARFLRDLGKSASVAAFFSPVESGTPRYDRDNMTLPSRSLWKMKNFGPTLWIYKI